MVSANDFRAGRTGQTDPTFTQALHEYEEVKGRVLTIACLAMDRMGGEAP
jgi:hypothetical protein